MRFPPATEAPPPSRILLIKPGSFGDVVHALPCATILKQRWPAAHLTWLVDDRWKPLLEGHPSIDEIVVFPRTKFRGLASLRGIPWMFGLARLKPDLAFDLQGLLRSALMAKFSRARKILGLGDAREGARGFYDRAVATVPAEHSVRRYLRILELTETPPTNELKFWLPPGSPPTAAAPSSFILLHPFARGAGKSLTEVQVLAFCQAVAPAPVVLLGTGQVQAPLPANVANFLNATTIPEMIWLIRQASFVVSVDSGPMHVAAAVRAPLLSVHTWSDPRLVGPFNESSWIWQGGEIRRQNLAPAILPPARSPAAADIQAIADFVLTQLRTESNR